MASKLLYPCCFKDIHAVGRPTGSTQKDRKSFLHDKKTVDRGVLKASTEKDTQYLNVKNEQWLLIRKEKS